VQEAAQAWMEGMAGAFAGQKGVALCLKYAWCDGTS